MDNELWQTTVQHIQLNQMLDSLCTSGLAFMKATPENEESLTEMLQRNKLLRTDGEKQDMNGVQTLAVKLSCVPTSSVICHL